MCFEAKRFYLHQQTVPRLCCTFCVLAYWMNTDGYWLTEPKTFSV